MQGFSGLDPTHYISLASYSYDSMLKMTKTTISIPPTIDMVHMLEAGKRGGMSFIGTRDLIASQKPGDCLCGCQCNYYLFYSFFLWCFLLEVLHTNEQIIIFWKLTQTKIKSTSWAVASYVVSPKIKLKFESKYFVNLMFYLTLVLIDFP